MQSAYDLMSEIADRTDKKHIKKLAYLKSFAEDDGDRWAERERRPRRLQSAEKN